MSTKEKVKQFVIKARWYILGTVLAIALSAGGVYGYKHYTYINSPEYYLEQLNAALVANDLETLALLVDFRALSDDMALRIQNAPIPKRAPNPNDKNNTPLSEIIQRTFMQGLLNKDETNQAEQTLDPLSILEPLPKDFAAQISGKLQLQAKLENEAVLSVSINYPRLKKDYRLLFLIEKKPDWIMTRLNNMDEILKHYVSEENKLEILREEKFQADNVKFQEIMDKQFQVNSCTAFLHTAQGSSASSLHVRITGYNKGPQIIHNMTFATSLSAQTNPNDVLLVQDLNMAARILPGVDLEDAYRIDLDEKNPAHASLINAKDLSCTAKPRVMTLNNGNILFTKKHRLDPIYTQK